MRERVFAINIVVLTGLITPFVPWAASPPVTVSAKTKAKASTALPALLQEIEAKYGTAKTLQADFTQVTFSTLGQKKESQGVIQASKPGKIRWETKSPDPSLLVSDGKTYWYYTPPFEAGEHGQLIIRKSTEVQSKLANALLSGSFSMTKKMDIRRHADGRYSIFPRPGTAGTVRKVDLEVDPKEKLIRKVILEHEGGNRAEISLTQIQLGLTLGDDLFQFKAPANTDVVNP